MKIRLTATLAALMLAGVAMAQPSEYYVWKNKTTGQTVCEPDMPTAQWIKQDGGPYEDAHCKVQMPR